jgi:ABC-type bacteriocin/lantibiotic exporter with double-glycine peptidase domain
MEGLGRACCVVGLYSSAVELDTRKLARLFEGGRIRAIALLEGEHFCYVDHVLDRRFWIAQYPREPTWVRADDLASAWTGKVLLVSKEPLPPALLGADARFFGVLQEIGVTALCGGGLWLIWSYWRHREKQRGTT